MTWPTRTQQIGLLILLAGLVALALARGCPSAGGLASLLAHGGKPPCLVS